MLNFTDVAVDVECRGYHSVDSSKWCDFVTTTSDCAMDEGFINYIQKAFCDFPPKLIPLVGVLYGFWLLLLFAGLGTTAERFFCPALEYIASSLKMSQNIAGMTIVAFGNGAPDIFSAIAAFSNSNPGVASVAIGALLGAAVLLTTGVIGFVTITRSFEVAKRPFLRDMVFFIATAFWTFYLVYYGEINLYHSIGFIALYIFYVMFCIVGRFINQRFRQNHQQQSSSDEETNSRDEEPLLFNRNENNLDDTGEFGDQTLRTHEHYHPNEESFDGDEDEKRFFAQLLTGLSPIDVSEWKESSLIMKFVTVLQTPWLIAGRLTVPVILLNEPNHGWNRPCTCLALLIAPVFCLFATKGYRVELNGVFPLWGLMLMIGLVLALITWFSSTNHRPPRFHFMSAYFGFVVSVIWIYTIANEMVNIIQALGVFLNVTNVIMGLTFLAWGNSIGDAVSDVTLAKQGYPRMSFSACFGGPLFNILCGVGLSCTIAIIKNNRPVRVKFTSEQAVVCAGLLCSLSISLIVIPLRGFKMTKSYGVVLISLYFAFLLIAILTGVGIIP